MKKLFLLFFLLPLFATAQQTYFTPGVPPGTTSFTPSFRYKSVGTDSLNNLYIAIGNKTYQFPTYPQIPTLKFDSTYFTLTGNKVSIKKDTLTHFNKIMLQNDSGAFVAFANGYYDNVAHQLDFVGVVNLASTVKIGYAPIQPTGSDFVKIDRTTGAVVRDTSGHNGGVGGSNKQIQFNDSGVPGGNINSQFDKSTGSTYLGNPVVVTSITGNVQVIGDSFAYGTGASPSSQRFSLQFANKMGLTEVNLGAPGTDLGAGGGTAWVNNLSNIPTKGGSDKYLIICLGQNDINTATTTYFEHQFAADWVTVLNYCNSHGWAYNQIILTNVAFNPGAPAGSLTAPQYASRQAQFSHAVDSIATVFGCIDVNLYSLVKYQGGASLLADGQHLNNIGHTLLAKLMYNAIYPNVTQLGQTLGVSGISDLSTLRLPKLPAIPTGATTTPVLLGITSGDTVGRMVQLPPNIGTAGDMYLNGNLYQPNWNTPSGFTPSGYDFLLHEKARIVGIFNDNTGFNIYNYFEPVDGGGGMDFVTAGGVIGAINFSPGNNLSFSVNANGSSTFYGDIKQATLNTKFYFDDGSGYTAGFKPLNSSGEQQLFNQAATGTFGVAMSGGTAGSQYDMLVMNNNGDVIIQNSKVFGVADFSANSSGKLVVTSKNKGFIPPRLSQVQIDSMAKISAINMVSYGSGYTHASISLSGTTGSGFAATAIIIGGQVVGWTITNGGLGYLTSQTATITGDGTGAGALVVNYLVPSTIIYNTTSNKLNYYDGGKMRVILDSLSGGGGSTPVNSFNGRTGTVVPVAGDYASLTETLTNKSISGSANTLSNIGNTALTNSAITLNGTATSLGGSFTVTKSNTDTTSTGFAPKSALIPYLTKLQLENGVADTIRVGIKSVQHTTITHTALSAVNPGMYSYSATSFKWVGYGSDTTKHNIYSDWHRTDTTIFGGDLPVNVLNKWKFQYAPSEPTMPWRGKDTSILATKGYVAAQIAAIPGATVTASSTTTFTNKNLTSGTNTFPTFNQNTTGTAANITGTTNSTITTLSALSLPYSQVTGTPTIPTAANPTNLITYSANNGSSPNFDRSDATHAADSTVIRTVANSYSLSGMQTKLNNYVKYTDTATFLGNYIPRLVNSTIPSIKTFTAAPIFLQTAIGTGTVTSSSDANTTAATSGNQQNSGIHWWAGQGYNPTTTTSQETKMGIYFQPVQGTTPTGNLIFASSVNGSAPATRATLNFSGAFALGGSGSIFTNARSGLTTTVSDGLLINDPTASTSVATIENSGSVHLQAHLWNTTATAADNFADATMYLTGTSGTSPNPILTFGVGIGTTSNSSPTTRATLDGSGIFAVSNVTLSGNNALQTGSTFETSDFASSGTAANARTTAGVEIGGVSTMSRVLINGGSAASPAANNPYTNFIIGNTAGIILPATGTTPEVSQLHIKTLPTITNGSSIPLPLAANLVVEAAPSGGTLNVSAKFLGNISYDIGSDATGDLDYRASNGSRTRLAVGTTSQVLGISGGVPAWVAYYTPRPAATRSAAGTLTLAYSNDYIFTGSTATYTLPALLSTANSGDYRIYIKNSGSGNITLNSNTGSTIYTTSLVSTMTIAPGSSVTLVPDGTTQFSQ